MKKGICLLILCFYLVPSFAKALPGMPLFFRPSIPISYSLINKHTVLYLPSSCSGMINDAVAGEGQLSVSVQGRIQNGQLSLQVKVDLNGSVITTVGSLPYSIDGNVSVSDIKPIFSEPVDVFVKGLFKLVSKSKSPNLYIGDIGYITVYPDGAIINHILDPATNPEYSHPKVYCIQ